MPQQFHFGKGVFYLLTEGQDKQYSLLKGKKGVNSQEEMILYQLREESDLLLKRSSISWGKGLKNTFYQKLMLLMKFNHVVRF